MSIDLSPKFKRATSADNATAVVTLTGIAGKYWTIDALFFSYTGTAPAGRLRVVAEDSTVMFDEDITSLGAGEYIFPWGLENSADEATPDLNQDLVCTLFAGGTAGDIGKLQVMYR